MYKSLFSTKCSLVTAKYFLKYVISKYYNVNYNDHASTLIHSDFSGFPG